MTFIHHQALARIHRYGIDTGVLDEDEPLEPAEGESWAAWRNVDIWSPLCADVDTQAATVARTLAALDGDVDPMHAVTRGNADVLADLNAAGQRLKLLALVRDGYATTRIKTPPTGLFTDTFDRTTRMFVVPDFPTLQNLHGLFRRIDTWSPGWLADALSLDGVRIKANTPDEQRAMSENLPIRKAAKPSLKQGVPA